MKILSIARKTLLELWREPLLLALLPLFPLLLLGFYYLAYGQTEQGLAYYLKVYVLNQDTGPAGAQLVAGLRAAEFEGEPVFDLTEVTDRQLAEIALRERKAALLVVIPPDLSATLEAAAAGTPTPTPATLALVGDPVSDSFIFVRSFLDDLLRQFTQQALGQPTEETVGYAFVPGTGTMSDVQFGIPGVIVFGVMFVTIAAAMILVRENVAGTLRRLQLTRAGAADILPGVTLALALVGLLQIPLSLGLAAWLFGFRPLGSPLLIVLVTLLLSVAAVGIGLVVACFAHSDSEAANLGATVAVLLALLSGALYPLPAVPLFTIGGRTIQIYDLLPPAHAGEALRRVLIFGDGWRAIAYPVGALAVLAALCMGLGVVLYQRLQLKS